MSHANLTARYRPQKFSELAGQETVRAILSRAAAESSVAPAYLFSGTRGVGKTTVARIFAKALNCAHAPVAEPCNECDNCRQITQGTAVDVVEIDGASNRGIDDVRKLKEVVGYAPMQGRYKVFIIDEAHMLSRDAFNALLKTLEEPPANVTFILATTEPHKFPATIISRCQHYVFKRLPENGLEDHLSSVLRRENVSFEEGAVRLIARRAAGSVRDAMSLLGQVLALGGETLTEYDTRTVLGLAGQELFFSLFDTLRLGNSAELTKMVGKMLDSGLDLGFFLREMALCWRNMFILRQAGDEALAMLDIPAKEADRWKAEAATFELAHIHAAWQMTIDGQRRVLTSLEPALALELLLCNIAMLPRLLSLEGLARLGRSGQMPGASGQGGQSGPAPVSGGQASGPASGQTGGAGSGLNRSAQGAHAGQETAPVTAQPSVTAQPPVTAPPPVAAAQTPVTSMETGESLISRGAPASPAVADAGIPVASAVPPMRETSPETVAQPFVHAPAQTSPEESFPAPEAPEASMPEIPPAVASAPFPVAQGEPAGPFDAGQDEAYLASMAEDLPPETDALDREGDVPPVFFARAGRGGPPEDCTWSAFLRFCKQRPDLSAAFTGMLRTLSGKWRNDLLELTPGSEFSAERLRVSETETQFMALVREYYGEATTVLVLPPPHMKTAAEIREALRENPAVNLLEKELGARLIDYGLLQQ